MKPGWEDVVRRCIQRFYAQHEGDLSFAKRHHQEGKIPIDMNVVMKCFRRKEGIHSWRVP